MNHRNTVEYGLPVEDVPDVVTFVEGDTESVYEVGPSQVEDQLGESFHGVRQGERGLVVADEVGVVLSPLAQGLVKPLPNVLLLLVQRLVDAHPGQVDGRSLLVETLCHGFDPIAPLPL